MTATDSVTTPGYTDTVGNGAVHSYLVTAVNIVGPGPFSNVASACRWAMSSTHGHSRP